MRILIVKLTSMGDLIQALPSLSDLHTHHPLAKIDWVVDHSFAEIPCWHPAVEKVYTTNHRSWRNKAFSTATWKDIAHSLQAIREQRYDYIVDLQTNCKSALVARLARGRRYGPARGDTAEFGAHLFYHEQVAVSRHQHAIARMRQLLARVFDYSYDPSRCDFSLEERPWERNRHMPARPYLVFATNASWPTKHLPATTWIDLARMAARHGFELLLPWGNETERQLAQTIAAQTSNATVLPRLSLDEIASLLAHSAGAICNDTGLAHIAAALGKPTVTAYGPTDPQLIAATGPRSRQLQAPDYPCLCCYKRRCSRQEKNHDQAACLEHLSSQSLWQALIEQQAGT